MESLLTPEQAAKILQVNEQTIRRYCRSDLIRYIRFGSRHMRIRESDLELFLQRNENTKGTGVTMEKGNDQ